MLTLVYVVSWKDPYNKVFQSAVKKKTALLTVASLADRKRLPGYTDAGLAFTVTQ